jgi:hypothetical protein
MAKVEYNEVETSPTRHRPATARQFAAPKLTRPRPLVSMERIGVRVVEVPMLQAFLNPLRIVDVEKVR